MASAIHRWPWDSICVPFAGEGIEEELFDTYWAKVFLDFGRALDRAILSLVQVWQYMWLPR